MSESSTSLARDSEPLSQREQDMLGRLLSDPTFYPMTLKTWLVSYLASSDLTIPISSVLGLSARLTGMLKRDPSGDVVFRLDTGQAMTVLDHTGAPLFRVDEDGDLHGKTGKALTFDL